MHEAIKRPFGKIAVGVALTTLSVSAILVFSCHTSAPDPEDDRKDDRHDKIRLEKSGELPKEIPESSGLCMLGTDQFITLNDSRGEPVIFVLDKEGKITRRITFTNENNKDWEEITSDSAGNYYVGDFGNNDGKRREFYVYKFRDPSSLKADTLSAEDIRFTLPDNTVIPAKAPNMNFDFEAMIHYGNSLYIFSKNRTEPYNGYCKLYRLPDTPGEYVATLLDSICMGNSDVKKNSITGAAINRKQDEIVLISHERCWTLTNFKGDAFFKGDLKKYEFKKSDLSLEGVCFGNNNDLYFTEERSDPGTGMLFRCELSDLR